MWRGVKRAKLGARDANKLAIRSYDRTQGTNGGFVPVPFPLVFASFLSLFSGRAPFNLLTVKGLQICLACVDQLPGARVELVQDILEK